MVYLDARTNAILHPLRGIARQGGGLQMVTQYMQTKFAVVGEAHNLIT